MVLRSMRAVLGADDRFRNRGAGHGALEHAHCTNRRLVLVSGLRVVRHLFGVTQLASRRINSIKTAHIAATERKRASVGGCANVKRSAGAGPWVSASVLSVPPSSTSFGDDGMTAGP